MDVVEIIYHLGRIMFFEIHVSAANKDRFRIEGNAVKTVTSESKQRFSAAVKSTL